MNQRSESPKLKELRSKTDRQLLTLIRRELDSGLALARSYDECLQARAIEAHGEVSRLLPLVYDLPVCERRRLESELDELANLLNAAA
jgi:hypothetical protein